MLCIAPGQTITIREDDPVFNKVDSWGLFFHPDLIQRRGGVYRTVHTPSICTTPDNVSTSIRESLR